MSNVLKETHAWLHEDMQQVRLGRMLGLRNVIFSSTFFFINPNEERALSYIHEEDNHLIITYPIVSQTLSTNFPLLQDMIPLNPPQISRAFSTTFPLLQDMIPLNPPQISQAFSTTFPLLQNMIPLNPPQISHISWIRYANQILHDFLLRNRLA